MCINLITHGKCIIFLQRPDSELSLAQQIPSDALLHQVAERAYNRDWNVLASKLNVGSDEITSIEKQYPDDALDQVK